MRRGKKILISRSGAAVANALLDVRACRDRKVSGSGPTSARDTADDQRAIIAHPLNRRAAGLNPVDHEAGDPPRLACGWRPDPQFDAFGQSVSESKLFAVGTPYGCAELSVLR